MFQYETVFIVKQAKNLDYDFNDEYLLIRIISCQAFRLCSLNAFITQ